LEREKIRILPRSPWNRIQNPEFRIQESEYKEDKEGKEDKEDRQDIKGFQQYGLSKTDIES
jgi:hypothetical protein